MIESKFDEINNRLETKYIGNVTCDEVIDYIRSTKLNAEFPRDLKIISDTSNGLFNFSIEDLDKIIVENNKSLECYNTIIDAIIVDNPQNSVLTFLYKELAKATKYKFEIFATSPAAVKWLNNW